MTLTKIEFASGLIKDDTPLTAEGGWTDADKVRFRQGKPETIGGWELASVTPFTGIARGGKAWTDLRGQQQLAFGTADKLYAFTGGAVRDITPPHSEGVLYDLSATVQSKSANYTILGTDGGSLLYVPNSSAGGFTFTLTAAATLTSAFVPVYIRNYGTGPVTLAPTGTDQINGVNASISIAAGTAISISCSGTAFTTTAQTALGPFTTVNASTTVTVTHAEHGLAANQTITFSNAVAVGGLTLNGTYTIATVPTRNTYTITAGSAATSTATGGGADYIATWLSGLADGTGGIGFGTGTYGTGTYGLPSVTDFLPSVWSLDNFGEVLLANRRGGSLYAWQPATAYAEIVLTGDFASDSNWAKGTNWAIGAGVATKTVTTASNLSQNIQGAVAAGYVYRLVFTVTRTTGTIKFRINAGSTAAVIDVGAASAPINQSGTYSRLFVMPDAPSDLVFAADAAFSGSIDNVSLKLESVAFNVTEAPKRIDSMFIDPNRVVVLLGTYEADGDYNPLLVRWSDQENFREYVPSDANLSGELAVAKGGRLIAGLASRQQDLVWSDDAVYSLQFTGDETAFSLKLLGTGCGLIGRHAASEHNGIAFWLSSNGNFYIFQGAIPQVIDCRVRRDMFTHIATSQGEKIFAGINAEFSEIWWFYPDSRDGTECSRYVAFNWIENHWTAGTMARSTWVPGGIFLFPIALGTDGYIYYHERGNTANGGELSSYLESSYFDIEDGEHLLNIRSIVPDFQEQSGSVDFYLSTKGFPNASEISGGPYTAATTTQVVNVRRLGRQAKVRMECAATGMFWRLGTLRFDTNKTGARR